ncbi:DNA-binding MarR family transcriptional regulator [Crossiella equi]|uniref:DNA-binding MarR family transcriptional regulator n=1 Tax=Crossiella equi TaxID=130796 RepID=A0ABS5AC75_9PSEU|nr:MarR family winged helix-turn-helix transcriptional regulator [Crossiella equi]MBP2473946.1 DNA-binding MarR family transcriptional regulator [Crossiella equi]
MRIGGDPERSSTAFLLAQLGFTAARRFAGRLAPLSLEPRHVGLMRVIAGAEGQTQQALGERLGIAPSRMVAFVDDLERRGLLERKRNPADRRAYALHLTEHGHTALAEALREAAAHDAELLAPLAEAERAQLHDLLSRLARAHGVGEAPHWRSA